MKAVLNLIALALLLPSSFAQAQLASDSTNCKQALMEIATAGSHKGYYLSEMAGAQSMSERQSLQTQVDAAYIKMFAAIKTASEICQSKSN